MKVRVTGIEPSIVRRESQMSAPAISASSNVYAGPVFWERMWRSAGIQSVACFVVAGMRLARDPA